MVVSCVCVCCVCVCLQKKRTKEVDLGIRGKGRKDCCLCVGAKLFLGLQRYRCWLRVCASEIKPTRTKKLRNVTQHAPHSAPRQSTIKDSHFSKIFWRRKDPRICKCFWFKRRRSGMDVSENCETRLSRVSRSPSSFFSAAHKHFASNCT